MTPPQATVATSTTVRLIYGAMVTGVVLFGIVAHFVLKPQMADARAFPPLVANALLGVAAAALAVAFLLRRRVPQRMTNDSADLFWTTAMRPALLTWAPIEAASLLAIVCYALTASQVAVAVAVVAIVTFAVLNPGALERS